MFRVLVILTCTRGVPRLVGPRGKMQVWCPRIQTWALSEADVLYWRKYLWHCWDFSVPPAVIRPPIIIRCPGNCAPLPPSLRPCTCNFDIAGKIFSMPFVAKLGPATEISFIPLRATPILRQQSFVNTWRTELGENANSKTALVFSGRLPAIENMQNNKGKEHACATAAERVGSKKTRWRKKAVTHAWHYPWVLL